MYARVTTGQIQPGKMAEFLNTYRESVKPMLEGFAGLKNVYVLTDTESGKVINISLYETEADAETQTSGDYQEAVRKLSSTLVVESIVRESYEVSILK